MPDAIVVGAGVIGASVAFHLAERGVDTLVLDRDVPSTGSTARSGALVRAHYPTILEADLAWQSITEYFEAWDERVGGDSGFTRTGFAFLAGEDDAEALVNNVSALKQEVGVDTEVLGPEELEVLDPAVAMDGVLAGGYEPRGGYADPSATTLGFMRAAERFGARFEKRRVLAIVEEGGRVSGVETDAGVFGAQSVVLAAGAWAAPLAAGVGLDLPIRPARIQVALFRRPYALPTHLTLIDTVEEIYARPTADRCTLVGMRTSELEWVGDPDGCPTGADVAFVERAAQKIGRRIPALGGAAFRRGWSGVVDMTPDGKPILGPEGPEGLYLAVGWSGKGFKKAPAVGAELARWAAEGSPGRERLLSYGLKRFEEGPETPPNGEYGSRSPH